MNACALHLTRAMLLLLGACSSPRVAAAEVTAAYYCADGRFFTVEQNAEAATVRYDDEAYRLAKRPSGIGVRFASPEATLIIDGDAAVFASETVIDLDDCKRRSA